MLGGAAARSRVPARDRGEHQVGDLFRQAIPHGRERRVDFGELGIGASAFPNLASDAKAETS